MQLDRCAAQLHSGVILDKRAHGLPGDWLSRLSLWLLYSIINNTATNMEAQGTGIRAFGFLEHLGRVWDHFHAFCALHRRIQLFHRLSSWAGQHYY